MNKSIDQRIEFPSAGATYCRDEFGVYNYGVYPRGSVLAGQESRSFLGSFDTLAEAQKEFPTAEWNGNGSSFREITLPEVAPAWFDPDFAGERWNEDE